MQIKPSDKAMFKSLSKSQYGSFLVEYVEDLVRELSDVSTMDNNPIKSRQNAVEIIRINLLQHLEDKEPQIQEREEDYV